MLINDKNIEITSMDFFLILRQLAEGNPSDIDLIALRREAPPLTDEAAMARALVFLDSLKIPEGHEHYAAEGLASSLRAASDLRSLTRQELVKTLGRLPASEADSSLSGFERKALNLLRQSSMGFVDEAFRDVVETPQGSAYQPWLDVTPLTRRWPRELVESPVWNRIESPVPGIPDQPLDDAWVQLSFRELTPEGISGLVSAKNDNWRDLLFDHEEGSLTVQTVLLKLRGLTVIAGRPGAGKSTLIKWLARYVVMEPRSPFGIPVLISLRQFAKEKAKNPGLTLFEFFLRSRGIRSQTQIERWRQLHDGLFVDSGKSGGASDAFLWLLDGWDELPVAQRHTVLPDIQAISLLPSILTTRYSGDPFRLPAERYFEICGLKHGAALELAHRWLSAVGREADFGAIEIGLEESSDLRRMARSPFLLTLICALATTPQGPPRSGWGWLPRHRGSVLGDTLRLIYDQHNQDPKQEERFSKRDIAEVAKFCRWLFTEATGDPRFVFDQDDYGRCLGSEERFERLLVPSRLMARIPLSPSDYQFLHASFQEYLVAEHLLRSADEIPPWETLILNRSWQDVARLLAEIADVTSPASERLWSAARSAVDHLDPFGIVGARIAELLAVAGVQDGGLEYLGVDIREHLWQVLETFPRQGPAQPLEAFLNLDATDLSKRILMDLKARDNHARMVHWLELVSVFDLEPLAEDEVYRQTMGHPSVLELCPQIVDLLGDGSENQSSEPLPSRVEELDRALARRDDEAVLIAFWQAFREGWIEYCFEAVSRFSQFPEAIASRLLLDVAMADLTDDVTRGEVVSWLMKLGSREAEDELWRFLASLSPEDFRITAILGNLTGYRMLPRSRRLLEEWLGSSEPETRISAADVLADSRHGDAAAVLVQALARETEEEVRRAFLTLLSRMPIEAVLEELWALRFEASFETVGDWKAWFRAVLLAVERRKRRQDRWGHDETSEAMVRHIRRWAWLSLGSKAPAKTPIPQAHCQDAVLEFPSILGKSAASILLRLLSTGDLDEDAQVMALGGLGKLERIEESDSVVATLTASVTDPRASDRVRGATCDLLGSLNPLLLSGIDTLTAERARARQAFRHNILYLPGAVLDAGGRPLPTIASHGNGETESGSSGARPGSMGEVKRSSDASSNPLPPGQTAGGSTGSGVGEEPLEDAELTIEVRLDGTGNDRHLVYTLRSDDIQPDGCLKRVRGPTFNIDPKEYQKLLLSKVEDIEHALSSAAEELNREGVESLLVGVGRRLFQDLFNGEMRLEYRRLRSRFNRLLILSEEPWIPWEMIKPYDAAHGEVIDDDFLCHRYAMTRWMLAGNQPSKVIEVRQLATVNGGRADPHGMLIHADEEVERIRRLAEDHPRIVDKSLAPESAGVGQLKTLLEAGGLGLLHIVAHGEFDSEDPDDAAIVLAHEQRFRSSEILGPIATEIGRSRPLVFFNVCHSGLQAVTLTGLGGWGQALVEAGCGGFVGHRWAIDDRHASRLVEVFYRELEERQGLGNAMRIARRELAKDSLLASLAPMVYGSPQAIVQFGDTCGASTVLERPPDETLLTTLATFARGARRALEPLILPRISRLVTRDKYLAAIRLSIERERHRVITLVGDAGSGKSTVLGELYDHLLAEGSQGWLAIVDCGSLLLQEGQDLAMALGRAVVGGDISMIALARQLNQQGATGVLLIDTLDLILARRLVPEIQEVLYGLSQHRVTTVISCRDYDYVAYCQPIAQRFPRVYGSMDLYHLPTFTAEESHEATLAFVQAYPQIFDADSGQDFAERLASLSAGDQRLQSITSNPLLLAMLCELYGPEGHVPKDLTVSTLYDRFWQVKVASSRAAEPDAPVTLAKPKLCLQVAKVLWRRSAERLVDTCFETDLNLEVSSALALARRELVSDGVLKILEGQRFRFFHQTLLEYTMARWLLSAAGEDDLERLLKAIVDAEESFSHIHWLPTLRQLLASCDGGLFDRVVSRLPLENLGVFRTVTLASVVRGGDAELLEMLSSALEQGSAYQMVVCQALDGAPNSMADVSQGVILKLLQHGDTEVAILAAETAGKLMLRRGLDSAAIPRMLEALEARGGTMDSDLAGQLLQRCLSALDDGRLNPDFIEDLVRRFSSFGFRTQAKVLELVAENSADRRMVTGLLDQPLRRSRLVSEHAASLLQTRFDQLVGSAPGCRWRLPADFLIADLEEGWGGACVKAVGRHMTQNPASLHQVYSSLIKSLERKEAQHVSRVLGALHVAATEGAAEEMLSLVLATDIAEAPVTYRKALYRIAADLGSCLCRDDSRASLARWYLGLKTEDVMSGLAAVADADTVTWDYFVAGLEELAAKSNYKRLLKVLRSTSPGALPDLLATLEPSLPRETGDAEHIRSVLHGAAAEGSRNSAQELSRLARSKFKRVANSASHRLMVLAAQPSTVVEARDFLPLLTSDVVGVVEHALTGLYSLTVQHDRVEAEVLLYLCRALHNFGLANTAKMACDLVYGWVQSRGLPPDEVFTSFTQLADRLVSSQQLDGGSAIGLIKVYKILAQLEHTQFADSLEQGISTVLGQINYNRVENAVSETVDVLSALARKDAQLLPRVWRGLPQLPEKNLSAIIGAIHRVDRGSPLLLDFAQGPSCSPRIKKLILSLHET